jgi:hypothetical protein
MEVLALLALALLWFLLPLLPALRELRAPSDVAPLKVVDRSSGHVAYFARNFRQYLDKQLPAEAGVGDYAGNLLDGTPFIRVNHRADALAPGAPGGEQRLVILDTPQALTGDGLFRMELFARAALEGAPGTAFRAVYAERELALGERSQVLRWTHAGGALSVGSHSVLRGRVSSDTAVSLASDVGFERIGAPVISAGRAQDPPPAPPADPPIFRLPEDRARRLGDAIRIEGDLDVPEGVLVAATLVVTGRLRIGLGAIVRGSLKAHGDLELGDEAQVTGSAVSRGRVWLGQASWVGGPAIAETAVRIGKGAVVGTPAQEATVAAPEVELAPGATVYGQISAARSGRTF